ncbi:MAG: MBL fold metallo-hydrolase [Candidatus Heimdallarchaeaceae archaeon]
MRYDQVTENVTLLRLNQGSNVICIALDNELVFIDSGLNTIIARDFRGEMEKKYERKASMLILTHGHIDHFLGMGAFSDCKIFAAETGKPRFERFVNLEFTEEILDNLSRVFPSIKVAVATSKLSMPNIWVKERKTFGKDQELVFQIIGGHSSCSSTIYYAPDKILMVGDLIQADVYPYFGEPDTDMSKWIGALKEWEAEDFQFILPGHGGVLTKNYIPKVRIFFEKLIEELANFKSEGVTEEDLVKRALLEEGYWPEDAVRKPAYNFSVLNLYRNL